VAPLEDRAAGVGAPGGRAGDAPTVGTSRRENHAAPLRRAVRGTLEAAHCTHELRQTLAEIRALRIRNRDLRALLDAGELVTGDLGAEVDGIGLALLQLEIVGGRS
jgi:hypothetical protein